MTTKYIEDFWRPATAADVARVMAGGVVEARFRDRPVDRWIDRSRLRGWAKDDLYAWIGQSRVSYKFCQVYDPPQYWLDKPEPGEGYRLLEKFPDEPVQGGDFFKNTLRGGRWIELANGCNPAQVEGVWYRRRIEQPKPDPKPEPKPEPKHYILQVGDTADTGNGFRITITEYGVEVI